MREIKRRHRSVNRLIPNAITLLGICAGMTAIRLALQDRWELAVAAVIVAGILDGLDGRVARLMSATSELGAQLDSLADFVNFGVTPALMIYLWVLGGTGGLGWAMVLVFAMCCALRLARFNASFDDADPPPWGDKFFTGVPAPAGAALALLPMVLNFEIEGDFLASAGVNGLTLLVVAALMVSRFPTYSIKRLRIPPRYLGFALLGAGGYAAFLVSTPWITLGASGLIYLFSIPFSIRAYRRLNLAESAEEK